MSAVLSFSLLLFLILFVCLGKIFLLHVIRFLVLTFFIILRSFLSGCGVFSFGITGKSTTMKKLVKNHLTMKIFDWKRREEWAKYPDLPAGKIYIEYSNALLLFISCEMHYKRL